RIPDYALQFADFNLLSSIGGFLFGISQLLLIWVVVRCVRGGKPAPDKAWEGAEGLEWQVPSPAPLHTFSTPPEFIPERDSPGRA
ncbi:MAG: cytochrome c oxidase subunit I, partial [Gammaproteobacteria bacterium]|nr:cytochrome c oxidase subunit I [Gammaproteobacteria bacterium]